MTITRFEDLECWQEARKLVQMVYSAVRNNGPFERDLRFSGQITAAAVSVMNNITEGWAAQSNAEFIKFLTYSSGDHALKFKTAVTLPWINSTSIRSLSTRYMPKP